jgi:hypothetical protein
MKMRNGKSETLTTSELREIVGVAQPMIVHLEQRGIIKRSAKNTWPAEETLRRLLQHYRRAAGRHTGPKGNLLEARLKDIRVRTSQRLQQLVPVAGVLQFHELMTARVLAELSELPARCRTVRVEQGKLEHEVAATRSRIIEFSADLVRKFRCDEAEPDLDEELRGEPNGRGLAQSATKTRRARHHD